MVTHQRLRIYRFSGRYQIALSFLAHPDDAESRCAGTVALLLSAVGIFALVANMVAQRTREIGIRMALGSTVGQAMVQIGRSGAGASLLGLVLGLVLCAGALRVMRNVLYGIGVYDAPTLGTVVLTLVLVTLLATTLPTLRIAKIDPANTLREE